MMAGENCVGQVIEARLTDRAAVTLALWLPVVMTMPGHLVTLAYWATHALGPPQTPDHVEALGLIDQGLKVDQAVHRPASSCWWRTRPRWIKPFLGHHPSPQQVAITIGSSARSPPPRNPNRAFAVSVKNTLQGMRQELQRADRHAVGPVAEEGVLARLRRVAGRRRDASAERCGVALSPAFRWRHRFLPAPAASPTLTGIVEADDP